MGLPVLDGFYNEIYLIGAIFWRVLGALATDVREITGPRGISALCVFVPPAIRQHKNTAGLQDELRFLVMAAEIEGVAYLFVTEEFVTEEFVTEEFVSGKCVVGK